MPATIADLLAVLKASSAPRLKHVGGIGRLDGNDRRAEDLRKSFLSVAAHFPAVYVRYDGGQPREYSLHLAEQVVPNGWCVPATATGIDLASWLSMGNWQLYARDIPLQKLRDLCRTNDAGVSRFVGDSAVYFIVDAFHDDTHWTIGLQSEA